MRSRPAHPTAFVAAALLAAAAAAFGGCRRPPEPARSTLRVGLGTTLSTLDPHADGTIAAIEQLGNVYEPLVALDAEMRARPCLAASWANPDPETWVFELRPGVLFQDGTPLTAEDVVFSLERLLGDERLRIRSYLPAVAGVEARGKGAVVVRTHWPNALLLNNLGFVPIVRKGSTAEGLEARPNGTGPWTISSWTPARRLVLRRNPSYWGPKPAPSEVRVELSISESEARSGLADSSWDILRFSVPSVEGLAERSPDYRVVRHENIFLRHLAFDVSREVTPSCPGIPNPFRKREVRQAISLALDRASIARRVDSYSVPAAQLVPPAVFGYDPGLPAHVPDVGRARRLLAEAGYPNGFDVILHRSAFEAAALEIREQLGRVGIRVTVTRLESPEFWRALARDELGFWIVANGCPTGDALELLWNSFSSPDPSRGAGVDNHGGYRSAAVDGAVEEAARQIEPALRLPVLRRGLAAALADSAWIPLYFSKDVVMVHRALSFRPRADGLLRYSDAWPASTAGAARERPAP